jgi:hypothetical protein
MKTMVFEPFGLHGWVKYNFLCFGLSNKFFETYPNPLASQPLWLKSLDRFKNIYYTGVILAEE